MNIKTIAKIIIVLGALLGLLGSLSYFFSDKFMYSYNQSIPHSEELIIGAFIFLISLASLLLAILAFGHSSYANSKLLFIIVIILGVILFSLLSFTVVIDSLTPPFIAALLILTGGVIGDIAVAMDQ